MLERAKRFALQGNPVTAVPYGNGHINRTFLITTDTGMRYMLQAVNGHVFPDTDGLMRNISLVTEHLRSHGAEHVLTVVPTADGRLYDRDEEGCAWRVFEYIENSVCLERAETEKDFYQSAVAFGRFQRLLRDFPASSLTETIPHFHDTPKRFSDFRAAVERDRCGRAERVRKEIASALERESKAASLTGPLGNGTLPLRVTHNDTKLNNVLLDARTGEPMCVIDLDTVMPGAAAYDFGDSIRFGASTAAEDEKDLDRVSLSLPLYEAYARGFLSECGEGMSTEELMSLRMGAWMMTMENAVRFLADYLDGDVYYSISRPEHNLDRCRTQLRLAEDMERKWDEMGEILMRIKKAGT
ncbi:MAG: aminoglycoside phosphotransferase family protein [Clostridia bacterium]|nr:aminoglycoside phosphotransferase family protein [Clostridia bacterium]